MPRWMLAALAFAFFLAGSAHAYESDVHYGLTKWLALQAGFDATQAEWVAVANQRVDGGLIDTMALGLEFACAGRDRDAAQQAQQRHYPATKPVPSPASQRVVEAGGPAARLPLHRVMQQVRGKEGLMFLQLGQALHPLQDSWAHQGEPSVPTPAALPCDPLLAAGHPAERGGPDSHAADLTHHYPAEALAMAEATYRSLTAYPPVQGKLRRAAPWERLSEVLPSLLRAQTKTAKRAWFVEQGLADTAFLAGTTLPDGPDPGPLHRVADKLPALPPGGSMQHEIDVSLRAFYDELLRRWLGPERLEAVVADLGPEADDVPSPGRLSPAAQELVARLKLWKWTDHGAAAALVHAKGPLGAARLRAVERLTRDGKGYLAAGELDQALFPLQASGPRATPLLPYIVMATHGDADRHVAILRLRHAPHDAVGWVAERQGGRWRLIDVISVID